ncbi:MAG: DUF1592 domain-containing protein, partial [Planctomycetes bacterium]|nr:DUF1592 domain-containing protein [Planctomycetota bacterium]
MKTRHRPRAAALAVFASFCVWTIWQVALQPGPAAKAAQASGAAADSTSDAEGARQFEAQIAPLLARHCVECHGPTAKKGRLDLSRKAAAFAGGKTGKAIVPGKADESLLWQYVDSDEMPKDRPPLSEEQKRLLRQWLDAGAVWTAESIDPAAYGRTQRAGENWVRRLTVLEYIETVRSAVGVDIERDARRMLPGDVRADGFSNTAYNLGVDLGHVEAYANLAQLIAARMDIAAFAARYTPDRNLSEGNMRRLISGMGKWLLRGPLDEQETAAFLAVSNAVVAEGGDFDEAVRYLVEAMLQSPRFIYRVERQHGDGGSRRLGAYELATRLSYILWGAPPDEELMRAADAGELADRGRVLAQVQRMLKDPRTIERSSRFIHEWLNLDRLSNLRPNEQRFPGWDAALAADMRDETLAFFKHVAWEEQRPLADLLNAQVTFATPRLARHYSLDQKQATAIASNAEVSDKRSLDRVAQGLLALYTFEEGRGDVVRDVSGAGDALDLKIENAAAVRWSEQGLAVNSSTLIAADRPPKKLIDAVKKSGGVTIEAWVTPANAKQVGPARIATLSTSVLARNFTLGQDGDKFDVRFRTTKTDASGLPSLSSPSGSVQTRPCHVVYTRDRSGKATLYIDGAERATRNVAGDVSNWDEGFRFALANEMSKDRTWLGTLHLVALYDRPLSAQEVRRNHDAGPRGDSPAPLAAAVFEGHRSSDLQALYTFDEGSGNTIRDTSNAGEPLDLKIENPSAVEWSAGSLTVKDSTLIATAGTSRRLFDAAKKSNAVTLEAWITPADVNQKGPARILTFSSGTGQRNFTLGQEGDKFDVRFRSTKTDGNGLRSLSSPGRSVETRPTHVVYTRDGTGRAKLYIDGEQKSGGNVDGDLSNWDASFRLALANETSKDRAWRGTYHLVAIYSRALTPEEIRSKGGSLSRYDLAAVPARGGLLTQGSVLTVGGDEASMVTRGLFVLRNLLYGTVSEPPPCVDTTPVPTKPGQSQRGIAMQRLSNGACSGCHVKFEPLAFGLEKFDGIGAYHEKDEHGNKLRDDGELLFPEADQPVSYPSSAELMNLLAGSDRVRMCITRKLTQFALGRPLVESDEPALAKIHEAAQKDGGTYTALITALVMS